MLGTSIIILVKPYITLARFLNFIDISYIPSSNLLFCGYEVIYDETYGVIYEVIYEVIIIKSRASIEPL